jgi:hypothetical protein
MFCAPGHVFGGTEGDEPRFHVLRCSNRFPWYRGRGVLFSSFAFRDSFSALPRPSSLVLMFCAPGLVSGGTEGADTRFHVLRARTRFRPCRGCRVLFSYFALSDSFFTVPRASSPVFSYCAPGLFFGGTEGVGSRFLILSSWTRFRRYRGRQVLFSCFALPDTFSTSPVFMFCDARIFSHGTEVVGSCFQVLCSETHFRRYRDHWVLFSCFARPDSFPAVPRASVPVFMFCANGLVFDRAEVVGSHFHILRSRTHF